MHRSGLCLGALVLTVVLAGGSEARTRGGEPRKVGSSSRAVPRATAPRPVRPVASRPVAYLFRGLFDVYSLGMDDLAGKLAARGIEARVYSHADEHAVAAAIIAQHGGGRTGSIALIGHSLGGGSAIVVAEHLGQAGIPVDLVVPIDPVSVPLVPANVRRVINYYLPNKGMGQPVGAGANFRGMLVNADLENNRRDSGFAGLTHTTIDKSPAVHAEIIREVQRLGRAPRD